MMSAFTHFVTEWAPLVGGLAGIAAFGEMLWRKLLAGRRAGRALRASANELRTIQSALRQAVRADEATRQFVSTGGPNDR